MLSRVRRFIQAAGDPDAGVLLQGAAALICIGFAVWLIFSWTNYPDRYAQAIEGWRLGGTHMVELTLVREDRTKLACAADVQIEDVRCEFRRNEQALAEALDDRRKLRPYKSVKGALLLGAGLWTSPDLDRAPAGRFTAVCNFHILGVTRSAAVRWDMKGEFIRLKETLPVGRLEKLRHPQMIALKKWRDPSERELSTLIAVVMIVGGVILRVQGVGAPAYFTFDEHNFANDAHFYLAQVRDGNDHPPLGKLLIAVGYLLFGYNSVGWRFASLCFGLFTLLIAYWLGRALFESRRAGLFAAACMAADGFFLAYSRTALLDGMLVCFVLWGFLAAVSARSAASVLSSVFLLGCATSIKWSGVMAVVPAAAAIWALGRVPRVWVLAFGLVPLVHAVIWMGALDLSGEPSDAKSLFSLMTKLYDKHLSRANEANALASPWYTWPLAYHPIVVKLSMVGGKWRYASSLGNLVFFAAGTLAVIAAPVGAGLVRLDSRWQKRLPDWADREFMTRALLLVLGWLALLSPWMVARGRFTFMYHYLPSYGFALMLVAGCLAALERARPKAVFVTFAAALGVALYFAPVWAEFTVSYGTANMRLLFDPWKP